MTDLIIFDVDGTLIDSAKLILDAQRLTAEALGLVIRGGRPASPWWAARSRWR
jgi:phosphoglycolate phosphatase-like HAD superfamily hydrolase